MQFGVVRERTPGERRVALTPDAVDILTRAGHGVLLEGDAGRAAGFHEDDYRAAGADITWNAAEVAERTQALVQVRAPGTNQPQLFREDGLIVGFIHLATATAAREALFRDRRITAIAYELLEEDDGERPVLETLSAIGGRMAVTLAARHMLAQGGGVGRLLGGVPGVPPLHVTILGAGHAGEAAAIEARRHGAQVVVLDHDPRALRRIGRRLPDVVPIMSTEPALNDAVAQADLLIGAVAVRGQPTPRLLRADHIQSMRPGSIFVDMSIDQGGCSETSRLSDPADPIYTVHGVRHLCIPNLPSEVAHTASIALVNSALPYLLRLAELGPQAALSHPGPLQRGCVLRAGQPCLSS